MMRVCLSLLAAANALACAGTARPVLESRTVPEAPSTASSPYDSAMLPAASLDSIGLPASTVDSLHESVRRAMDQMMGLFVESNGAASPASDSSDGNEPVTWDIDVRSYLTHDRVEFYLDRFTGDARERVESWLQRGRRYEPMIRSTLRAAGIPEDMYYLAFVESGYDPHAYSRAAAVGMWQFMTATARGMGLRVDWWVDERRDPVRSTRAAARFLAGLRDQFGSLYLAAAAYNGGPGRVARGLNRYADELGRADGDDRFFALADLRALRAETSNYVPQLIAAALIGKEPSRYGMSFDDVPPFAYDSARVPASTPVAAVARAAGVALDSIRDLNPHILRGVTAPSESSWVRMPVGTGAAFAASFDALGDTARTAFRRVKAKAGATMAGVAKTAGVTVIQLRWYNPKLRGAKIPAGTTVLVPTRDVVSAAFSVPDPGLERYGAAVNGVHVVRRGETLSHIARRNGTTVATLMRLNHLKKSVIYPGQAILVRARAAR
jgi:membrane-bound lytic murein transglycosylase D